MKQGTIELIFVALIFMSLQFRWIRMRIKKGRTGEIDKWGKKNLQKPKLIRGSQTRFRKTFSILIFKVSKTFELMNYKILLESYAAGESISKDELSLIQSEIYSQLESIKLSLIQGCTEKLLKTFSELLKYAEVVV